MDIPHRVYTKEEALKTIKLFYKVRVSFIISDPNERFNPELILKELDNKIEMVSGDSNIIDYLNSDSQNKRSLLVDHLSKDLDKKQPLLILMGGNPKLQYKNTTILSPIGRFWFCVYTKQTIQDLKSNMVSMLYTKQNFIVVE